MDNYNQLVSRIAESSGLGMEEIERKVEAKRAKLSGLVSREGAAQIIASELGINFDQERMKIAELVQSMRRVNVIGKILEVYQIREFNKGGREGKVCSFLLADDSSNIRTVLWDNHHIELIRQNKLKADDVVEISNASVRNGELHLNSFSDIKQSKEILNEVVKELAYSEKKLGDVRPGMKFKTRAVIVHVFEPRYFDVCPKCWKKVEAGSCLEHGKIIPEKRAVLSIILDDGTENLRCVLFREQVNKLGLINEEIFSLEEFRKRKDDLLGEEMFFSGNLRNNEVFNTSEIIVENVEKIDAEKLIKELETKL